MLQSCCARDFGGFIQRSEQTERFLFATDINPSVVPAAGMQFYAAMAGGIVGPQGSVLPLLTFVGFSKIDLSIIAAVTILVIDQPRAPLTTKHEPNQDMLAIRDAIYTDESIATGLMKVSGLRPSHCSRTNKNPPAQNPGLGIKHKQFIQSLNGRNASHGTQASNQVTFFEDARFIVRRYVKLIGIGARHDTGSA